MQLSSLEPLLLLHAPQRHKPRKDPQADEEAAEPVAVEVNDELEGEGGGEGGIGYLLRAATRAEESRVLVYRCVFSSFLPFLSRSLSLSPPLPPSLPLSESLSLSRRVPSKHCPSAECPQSTVPFLRSLAYRPQISNTRPDSVCLSLYPFSCPRLACSVSQQSLSLSSVSKPAQTCNRPNEVVPVVVAVAAPVALPAALLLASLFEYSAPAMLKAKFCGAARPSPGMRCGHGRSKEPPAMRP